VSPLCERIFLCKLAAFFSVRCTLLAIFEKRNTTPKKMGQPFCSSQVDAAVALLMLQNPACRVDRVLNAHKPDASATKRFWILDWFTPRNSRRRRPHAARGISLLCTKNHAFSYHTSLAETEPHSTIRIHSGRSRKVRGDSAHALRHLGAPPPLASHSASHGTQQPICNRWMSPKLIWSVYL